MESVSGRVDGFPVGVERFPVRVESRRQDAEGFPVEVERRPLRLESCPNEVYSRKSAVILQQFILEINRNHKLFRCYPDKLNTNKEKIKMSKVNCKEIRERAVKMDVAWEEGAASVDFGGVKRSEFEAKMAAGAAVETAIDDLEAQIKMKIAERDEIYSDIDDDSVKVRNGVVADPNFGDDSPLYGAMGFIRKSERASGLTRKKKTP